MRAINISDYVYKGLQELAEPFVDTPETVLKKLLKHAGECGPWRDESVGNPTETHEPAVTPEPNWVENGGGGKPKRRNARRDEILPMSAYGEPIITALNELGGEGDSRSVLRSVKSLMKGTFKPKDREQIPSGEVRWRYRAHMHRLNLIRDGLLDRNAPRGTWRLTSAGEKAAKEFCEKKGG